MYVRMHHYMGLVPLLCLIMLSGATAHADEVVADDILLNEPTDDSAVVLVENDGFVTKDGNSAGFSSATVDVVESFESQGLEAGEGTVLLSDTLGPTDVFDSIGNDSAPTVEMPDASHAQPSIWNP